MTFKLLLVFHLIGASVWVGGHLVLAFTILPKALRRRDPEMLNQFESSYERIGIPALLVQIITGIWLTYYYAGNLFDVFDFANSTHTLIALKLILLVATLIIGVHARLRIIPKLSEETLGKLAAHIIAITTIALVILFLGAGIRVGGW